MRAKRTMYISLAKFEGITGERQRCEIGCSLTEPQRIGVLPDWTGAAGCESGANPAKCQLTAASSRPEQCDITLLQYTHCSSKSLNFYQYDTSYLRLFALPRSVLDLELWNGYER